MVGNYHTAKVLTSALRHFQNASASSSVIVPLLTASSIEWNSLLLIHISVTSESNADRNMDVLSVTYDMVPNRHQFYWREQFDLPPYPF